MKSELDLDALLKTVFIEVDSKKIHLGNGDADVVFNNYRTTVAEAVYYYCEYY